MPIIVPPDLVESLPFPSMSDQLNGTYNSKAYAWAERHPYVAAAMSGQADATYENALYVKDRADTLDLSAQVILENIQTAQDAATTASNAASDATDAADSAANSAAAAAASAGSIDTAYLRNRANHTGTQPVSTITNGGVQLMNAQNEWLLPQKMNLAPKDGSLLSIQGEGSSAITQVGLGWPKLTTGLQMAVMDFYAGRVIRDSTGKYPDYFRIGTEGNVHVIAAYAGNSAEASGGSRPIDVQVNGSSIMTFFAAQVNVNKPFTSNGTRVQRGQTYSAPYNTADTTWNRLFYMGPTNQPWSVEGYFSMPGVHWLAKITFSGTVNHFSPTVRIDVLGFYPYFTMMPCQFRLISNNANDWCALDFKFTGGGTANQTAHFDVIEQFSIDGQFPTNGLGQKAGSAGGSARILPLSSSTAQTYTKLEYSAGQTNATVMLLNGVTSSISVPSTAPTV